MNGAFWAEDPAPETFDTFFFVKNRFEHTPATSFSHCAFFWVGQTGFNRKFLQTLTSV